MSGANMLIEEENEVPDTYKGKVEMEGKIMKREMLYAEIYYTK